MKIKTMSSFIRTAVLSLLYILIFNSSVNADTDLLSVSVKPLSSILIESKQSSPATTVSLNTSVISAEITGRAFRIYAKTGDSVKANQKLVVLDCRSYDLAQKQAEASLKVSLAQLNLAKKQLRRNQQLIAKGTIPRELLESSQAAQESSLADIEFKKAQIETAKLAVKRCTIRAPFNAQITQKMVQQGQLLVPGSALFELMQKNKLEIKTNLSPSDVALLKTTPSIEFVTDNGTFEATLRSVIQQVDESTRTQEVRLSLTKNIELPVGLAGRMQWSNNEQRIPPEYVLRNGSNLGIMTATNSIEGTAKAKFIALENAVEGQPAAANLTVDTLVIDKNRYRVTDGEIINIKKE